MRTWEEKKRQLSPRVGMGLKRIECAYPGAMEDFTYGAAYFMWHFGYAAGLNEEQIGAILDHLDIDHSYTGEQAG